MLLFAGGTRLKETSTVAARDQSQIADKLRTRFELVFNEISTCQATAVGHKRVCDKWEWAQDIIRKIQARPTRLWLRLELRLRLRLRLGLWRQSLIHTNHSAVKRLF